MPSNTHHRYCLLVPHFNHAQQLIAFLPTLAGATLPIVIVDDGSDDDNRRLLSEHKHKLPDVHIFLHAKNRGKGAAIRAGFIHARALGFTHVVQIDADGQHDVNDVPKFVKHSVAKPEAVICGKPYFDDTAPKSRVYGRRITDPWVALETLSLKIKDALCGFRVYPLTQIETVVDTYYIGPRMDFDPELLVKCIWSDIELVFIDTYVKYPETNVSHFNYIHDNWVLVKLHSRLVAGMIIRLPKLLIQIIRGRK